MGFNKLTKAEITKQNAAIKYFGKNTKGFSPIEKDNEGKLIVGCSYMVMKMPKINASPDISPEQKMLSNKYDEFEKSTYTEKVIFSLDYLKRVNKILEALKLKPMIRVCNTFIDIEFLIKCVELSADDGVIVETIDMDAEVHPVRIRCEFKHPECPGIGYILPIRVFQTYKDEYYEIMEIINRRLINY